MLQSCGLGFGSLAFNVLASEGSELPSAANVDRTGLTPRRPQFPARAKRVIFLFMHGGPSHVDLFDPKPQLEKDDGKPLPFDASRVQFASRGNLMKSPWRFRPCGESGLPMSELWQHLPQVADELCMVHSMCETNVSHGGACMKMHTGHEALVRPSLGSWVTYGLGTENQDLPGFVTICPTSLHGGVNNFGAAFLPPAHQGVPLGTPGYPNTLAKDAKFEFMNRSLWSGEEQRRQIETLRRLHELSNHTSSASSPIAAELEARLKSFELAFRMQSAAPQVLDLDRETADTRKLYGLDEPKTENYGRQCLMARQLIESGVRFVQVSHAHTLPYNNEQWDQHTHLVKGHTTNVGQIDRPITGLLLDLKQRGLLKDTLVIWSGEFGRTPTVQAGQAEPGRDHHPEGFTLWMAGGGVKRVIAMGRLTSMATMQWRIV